MDYYYLGFAAAAALGLLVYFKLKQKKLPVSVVITAKGQIKQQMKSQQTPQNIKVHKSEPKQQVRPVQAVVSFKKAEQLQAQYPGLYFGSFRLKPANSMHSITSLDFKGSRVLLATTKNQLIMFNLKGWKKDSKHSTPQKYFVSLQNNGASAVSIGQTYYYAALTYDKTIVVYEFVGQNNVYFKQHARFPRNIFKSNASSIHVSKLQKYIVTTGTAADTVVDVWSMRGEKLATTNSFQIQHYHICCGERDILIRGWTSQVKIFNIVQEKDGSFKKIEKGQHLAHEESPLSSSIDNKDMYSMTISKSKKVKIWHLHDTAFHRTTESSQQSHPQLYALELKKCGLYTMEPAIGHFKTLVVLAHSHGFVVTDTKLKILHQIEGIEVDDIWLNGTTKSMILGVKDKGGLLSLWNLTKDLDSVSEVNI